MCQRVRKQRKYGSVSCISCKTCGRDLQERQNLERDIHQTLEQIERREIGLKQAEMEGKRKEKDIQHIRNKVRKLF